MEEIKKSMEDIAKTLSTTLKSSVCIRLESWHHHPEQVTSFTYRISIVPGLDDEECTQIDSPNWNQFQYEISKLLERGML
jgi:DNA polymerase III psi subunit